jgi:hypothetical protein
VFPGHNMPVQAATLILQRPLMMYSCLSPTDMACVAKGSTVSPARSASTASHPALVLLLSAVFKNCQQLPKQLCEAAMAADHSTVAAMAPLLIEPLWIMTMHLLRDGLINQQQSGSGLSQTIGQQLEEAACAACLGSQARWQHNCQHSAILQLSPSSCRKQGLTVSWSLRKAAACLRCSAAPTTASF